MRNLGTTVDAIRNLLTPEECLSHRAIIGSKALHLAELLVEQRLPIPQFMVISTSTCGKLADKKIDVALIVEEVISSLTVGHYAVRSSALAEDSADSAMAGQFRTFLDVNADGLASSIQEVLVDTILKTGHSSQCSIIIQEFLSSKYSGVLFTRNPSGGREAILEYVKGRGDALVSGLVLPTKLTQIWNQPIPMKPKWLETLLAYGKSIEEYYHSTQDIEWCFSRDKVFILQARPVTTIKKIEFETYLLLDRSTPSGRFLYEQNEVSEIIPRPTPFTLSLLKRIYASNGPVDRVYRTHGIRYRPNDFLKILGNQLYVDRTAEKECFFPSASFGDKIIAYRNKKALQSLRLPDIKEKGEQLGAGFEKPLEKMEAKQAIAEFLESYRMVFSINLFAQLALSQLEAAGRPLKRTTIELLEVPVAFSLKPPISENSMKTLRGNSLEIAANDPFAKAKTSNHSYPPNWFKALPAWQQAFIQPKIDTAQAYIQLREYGRWYTVWLINALRENLHDFDPYLTVDCYEKSERPNTLETKNGWEKYNSLTLPVSISDSVSIPSGKLIGLSPGEASGKVVSISNLPEEGKWIVATTLLTPDLVSFFPRISAIISTNGGLLSHLAIMAREEGIPVVSSVSNLDQFVGTEVTVNGSSATIIKSEH